jgi:hypothetical protein
LTLFWHFPGEENLMNRCAHDRVIAQILTMTLSLVCANLGFGQPVLAQATRQNCPLWPMMLMGDDTMYMSNEYIVEDDECTDGPFLSMWYGQYAGPLPALCPHCDPVGAPANPDVAPAVPPAQKPPAKTTTVTTGSPFPGYSGGKKTGAFRPHEQPVDQGGFPEFGPDKLKPTPNGTPPRLIYFDYLGETYFAIVLEYQIKPRKACKHSPHCNELPKKQDVLVGYEIQYSSQYQFVPVDVDPNWDTNQTKAVRILLPGDEQSIVLLASDGP